MFVVKFMRYYFFTFYVFILEQNMIHIRTKHLIMKNLQMFFKAIFLFLTTFFKTNVLFELNILFYYFKRYNVHYIYGD